MKKKRVYNPNPTCVRCNSRPQAPNRRLCATCLDSSEFATKATFARAAKEIAEMKARISVESEWQWRAASARDGRTHDHT